MKSTLSLLLVFHNHFFMPRHNAQLRLLKAQVAILRARIPTQRIILSPAEKAELLRIGAECGHEIDGLLEVAKPATYRRWLAQMRAGTPFKAVGRPRLTQELRDVVIRIGSENLLCAYDLGRNIGPGACWGPWLRRHSAGRHARGKTRNRKRLSA